MNFTFRLGNISGSRPCNDTSFTSGPSGLSPRFINLTLGTVNVNSIKKMWLLTVKLAETDATAVAKAATATVENFILNVYL